MAEPKTVEAKGAVDSQAAVQVEAKSKVMCYVRRLCVCEDGYC
jgi:hypothetical protein